MSKVSDSPDPPSTATSAMSHPPNILRLASLDSEPYDGGDTTEEILTIEEFTTEEIRRARDQKAKEFEVQGILGALLLGVAGGGLFVGVDIDEGPVRTFSAISFCIAVFAFMSTAISSGAFMILVQTSDTTPDRLGERIGIAWYAPKAYFALGYLAMTAGITGVFLCLISGGSTLACLAFCAGPMTLPNMWMLWKVYKVLQKDHKRRRTRAASLMRR